MNVTGLRSWLLQTHSLSNRLAEVAGDASLQVIRQGLVDETQVWQREIYIQAQGEPCWYARTVVSEHTYLACQDFFDQLKTKSLGQLIYHSPIVQRISLMHYPIGRAAAEFQWLPEAIQQQDLSALWLRSSHFRLRERNCSGRSLLSAACPRNPGISRGNKISGFRGQAAESRLPGAARAVTRDHYFFHLTEIFLPIMQRYCK